MPTRIARRIVPGWLAGILAASAALIAIGFVSIGFYASYGGIVIAGAVAIFVGSTAAAAFDRRRAQDHAGVVAFYVLALGAAYVLFAQALASTTLPGAAVGSRGGPGIDVPMRRDDGPVTYPPQQLHLRGGALVLQPAGAVTIYECARLI